MEDCFFIVLDGIDGCGSSTHTRLLGEYFKSIGKKVYLTAEPSNLGVGKLLREYLKNNNIPAPTDALLFAADRVEHYYNEILPKLKEGYCVISDRYLESSIAYQAAQGMNNEFDIDIPWIKTINKYAIQPDLTIILDIEAKKSLQRKYSKDADIDKFENSDFLEKVRKIYLDRAKDNDFSIINADNPLNDTKKSIQELIQKKFKL